MEESETTGLLEKSECKKVLIKSDVRIFNSTVKTLFLIFKGQKKSSGPPQKFYSDESENFERLCTLGANSGGFIKKESEWLLPFQIWAYQRFGNWQITSGDQLNFSCSNPKKFYIDKLHGGNFVFCNTGEELHLKDVGFFKTHEIQPAQ